MNRHFAILAVVLLCSAMFVVAVCEGGGRVTRPLKAMWNGITYIVGPCPQEASFPEGSVQVVNIGKGVSTITGQSDWFSVYCVYFDSAASMAGSGWGIMTGADGDAIHVAIDVAADLSKDPVEWFETEYTLGGTGRFEGAAGYSESHGTWTLGTDPFPLVAGIPPLLFQPPQGWEGTSKGEISF